MWTLVRPDGAGIAEFQQYVLDDLAEAAGGLVPGVNSVRVTLQERNAFCGGVVNVGGADRRVDAVLQITSADSYVATDPVNSVLSGNCGHVQGWRVHPTTIHDTSVAQPLGTADAAQADAVDQPTPRWDHARVLQPELVHPRGTPRRPGSRERREPRQPSKDGIARGRCVVHPEPRARADHADGVGRQRVRRLSDARPHSRARASATTRKTGWARRASTAGPRG